MAGTNSRQRWCAARAWTAITLFELCGVGIGDLGSPARYPRRMHENVDRAEFGEDGAGPCLRSPRAGPPKPECPGPLPRASIAATVSAADSSSRR